MTFVGFIDVPKLNKMNDKYVPVACEIVDHIEILATQRKTVEIEYKKGNNIASTAAVIKTWFTKGKEEFLETKLGKKIRLDSILKLNKKSVLTLSNCNI